MGFFEFRNEDDSLPLEAVLEVEGEEDGIEKLSKPLELLNSETTYRVTV